MDKTQPNVGDNFDPELETDEEVWGRYVPPCRYCRGLGYRSETVMSGAWEGSVERHYCRFCAD